MQLDLLRTTCYCVSYRWRIRPSSMNVHSNKFIVLRRCISHGPLPNGETSASNTRVSPRSRIQCPPSNLRRQPGKLFRTKFLAHAMSIPKLSNMLIRREQISPNLMALRSKASARTRKVDLESTRHRENTLSNKHKHCKFEFLRDQST